MGKIMLSPVNVMVAWDADYLVVRTANEFGHAVEKLGRNIVLLGTSTEGDITDYEDRVHWPKRVPHVADVEQHPGADSMFKVQAALVVRKEMNEVDI
jgi:hypothetical protein